MGNSWHIIDAQGILCFFIPFLSAWKWSFTCRKRGGIIWARITREKEFNKHTSGRVLALNTHTQFAHDKTLVFERRNQWRKKQQLPAGLWHNKWPRDLASGWLGLWQVTCPLWLSLFLFGKWKDWTKCPALKILASLEACWLAIWTLRSPARKVLSWHDILTKFKSLLCLFRLGQSCPGQQPLPSLLLMLSSPAYCLCRDCNFLIGMHPCQQGWEVSHRPHVSFPFMSQ